MLYAECWIAPEKLRKAKSAGSSCCGACRHLRMYARLFLQCKKKFSERMRRFKATHWKTVEPHYRLRTADQIVPRAALAYARVLALVTTGTGREPESLRLRDLPRESWLPRAAEHDACAWCPPSP